MLQKSTESELIVASKQTLYTTLPTLDANKIRSVIQESVALPLLSIDQYLKQLRSEGISSALFKPLLDYLAYAEGVHSQTYLIGKDITIGIGLDLTQNQATAKALFYELNPDRDWDYANLFTKTNLPDPPLTTEEINSLLFFSIVGVTNEEGKFQGYGEQLSKRLKDQANTPFQVNQLVAMISLVYNGGKKLIGKYMLSALANMKQTNTDLDAMIQIVSYSNAKNNVGLQNRRLKDGAVFHGNADQENLDVYLTWGKYQKILASNGKDNVVTRGSPVQSGIPIGKDQITFKGYPKITIYTSCGVDGNDTTIFGTPINDILSFPVLFGSPSFYGGDSNDTIKIESSREFRKKNHNTNSYFGYPYFAGGLGHDLYYTNSLSYRHNILIYDSDRKGKIITDGFCGMCQTETGVPHYLSGPIINDKYFSCNTEYNVTLNEDSSVGNALNIVTSSGMGDEIYVTHFQAPQFGLLTDSYSHVLPIKYEKIIFSKKAISTNGTIALQQMSANVFDLYDANGTYANSFTIDDFTKLKNQNFIPTLNNAFYASAILREQYNDTLWATEIDGSTSNVELQEIAVQIHDEFPCNPCHYFSDAYPIPIKGSVVLATKVEITNFDQRLNYNCELDLYFDKNPILLSNTTRSCRDSYISVRGWPIHQGGFLLTYGEKPSTIKQEFNTILLCDAKGNPYEKFNLDNIRVLGTSLLSNGFAILLYDRTSLRLYSRMYRQDQGWLTDLTILPNVSPAPDTIYQSLPNDKTLLSISNCWSIIIDFDNTFFSGFFKYSNNFMFNMIMSTSQKNGDVIALILLDTKILNIFTLSTSQLNIPLLPIESEKTVLPKIKKYNHKINPPSQTSESLRISPSSYYLYELLKSSCLTSISYGFYKVTPNLSIITENDHHPDLMYLPSDFSQTSYEIHCVGVRSKDNVSSLICNTENYQAQIFFTGDKVTNSDNFIPSTCRSIYYFGSSSVVCDGEKTSLIYTPKLLSQPLVNLDGNIMLGAVSFHFTKSVVQWMKSVVQSATNWLLQAPKLTKQNVSQEYFQKEINRFAARLNKLKLEEINLKTTDNDQEIKWLRWSIENSNQELQELQKKGIATKQELRHVALDIAAICKEVVFEKQKYSKPSTQAKALKPKAKYFFQPERTSQINPTKSYMFFVESHSNRFTFNFSGSERNIACNNFTQSNDSSGCRY